MTVSQAISLTILTVGIILAATSAWIIRHAPRRDTNPGAWLRSLSDARLQILYVLVAGEIRRRIAEIKYLNEKLERS